MPNARPTVTTNGWYAKPESDHPVPGHSWILYNPQGKFMARVSIDKGFEWPLFNSWAREAVGLTEYQAMQIIVETQWSQP